MEKNGIFYSDLAPMEIELPPVLKKPFFCRGCAMVWQEYGKGVLGNMCSFPRHLTSSPLRRKDVFESPREPYFTYESMLCGAHAKIEIRPYAEERRLVPIDTDSPPLSISPAHQTHQIIAHIAPAPRALGVSFF